MKKYMIIVIIYMCMLFGCKMNSHAAELSMLYNNYDYVLTIDTEEKEELINTGWLCVKNLGNVPDVSDCPVYCLTNSSNKHVYTTDLAQVDYYMSNGYTNLGISFYSDTNCSEPLYIVTYNSDKNLVGYASVKTIEYFLNWGWKNTGILCYLSNSNVGNKKVVYRVSDLAEYQLNTEYLTTLMLNQVNEFRQSKGLNSLELADTCTTVANIRVNELPTLVSHCRPNGKKFYTAYTEIHAYDRGVCENVLMWQHNLRNVPDEYLVKFLLYSYIICQDHYKNLTDPDMKYVGFGFVYENNILYNAQEFSVRNY